MSNIDNDYEDGVNDGISPPTPGPWKVVTSWYDYCVEGPNGEEIIWQDGPYSTPTIKLSDARLIAAAPEMYELLEEYAQIVDADAAADWFQRRQALLDKIEGGGE